MCENNTDTSKRDFLKKSIYIAPAIVTLNVLASTAAIGSTLTEMPYPIRPIRPIKPIRPIRPIRPIVRPIIRPRPRP